MRHHAVLIKLTILLVGISFLVSCVSSYKYPEKLGFTQRSQYSAHEGSILDMDISSSGGYLATGGQDAVVKIWELPRMVELGTLEGHPDEIYSVEFGPETKRVVTGCRDGVARVYALPSGDLVHELRGHAGPVYTATFSGDGDQIITGGDDSTVRVWDSESGELQMVFRGHSDKVNKVISSKDGKFGYSTSDDGTIRSWYLDESLVPGFIERINRFSTTNIVLSPNEQRIAFTGQDKVYDDELEEKIMKHPLYIADLSQEGLEDIEIFLDHDKTAWGLAWSPDGNTIVTGGSDERMFVYDLNNTTNNEKVLPFSGYIWDIEFSRDGQRIYLATSKNDIIVYTKEKHVGIRN